MTRSSPCLYCISKGRAVLSPNDESWEKLPYYAAHGVDEVLIVDPQEGSVSWLALEEGRYRPVQRSALIAFGATALAGQLDWPPVEDAQP